MYALTRMIDMNTKNRFQNHIKSFLNNQAKVFDALAQLNQDSLNELSLLHTGNPTKNLINKVLHNVEHFIVDLESFGPTIEEIEHKTELNHAMEIIAMNSVLYRRHDKETVCQLLAEQEYENSILRMELDLFMSISSSLSTTVTAIRGAQIPIEMKRQSKNAEKYAIDKSRQLECLKEVLAEAVSAPTPDLFLTFFYRLKRKYPKPAYVKSVRLTKEEKALPDNLREGVIKGKSSDEWKMPTLRKFFTEVTGIKVNKKIYSSLN